MGGYARVADHRSMVFDEVRNAAYRRAIEAAVKPDSVVVDLGAGLGIHGLMAARAGARRVYLVEPEPVLEVARQIVADNGFDNVELIAARGEELELPEPADLIISVFTGNFLLTEDLLPALFSARDQCLRPGGQLLPDLAQMQVAPVSAGAFHDARVGRWSGAVAELQGLDFGAARRFAANTAYYDSAETIGPTLLAAECVLLELDLISAADAVCNHGCEVTVSTGGVCHGWLGWFRMRLGEEWLSTSPSAAPMHWSQVLLPLDPPLELEPGERISLHLQRPRHGEWVWTTRTARERQRSSTFFSTPAPLDQFRKRADIYQPAATARVAAAAFALSLFDGATTTVDIAAQLLTRWPAGFADDEQALDFVRELARQFG